MNEIVTDPSDPALGGNMRGGDPASWCPRLWRNLLLKFPVISVLDVGCGEGHAVKWFADHGAPLSIGIDGCEANVSVGGWPVIRHDLRTGPYPCLVDMVWCCEVVEHIEERYVNHLLATLSNGRVIAMTHATPDQLGYHHVNCQPDEYWIERITRMGYYHDQAVTDRWREVAEEGTYFRRTGLLFVRGKR